MYISLHLLSCGGALLFIDSAALTLINSVALLLISVKTRIILGKQSKLTHTWCYISAHTLAHWNIDQCLIGSSPGYNSGDNVSLSGIKRRQSLSVSILTLEGEANGWGTLRVEVTRRREMRRDTWIVKFITLNSKDPPKCSSSRYQLLVFCQPLLLLDWINININIYYINLKSQKDFGAETHSRGQTHKTISRDADGQYERGKKKVHQNLELHLCWRS